MGILRNRKTVVAKTSVTVEIKNPFTDNSTRLVFVLPPSATRKRIPGITNRQGKTNTTLIKGDTVIMERIR
jgi:hypothetical protein